MGFLGLKGAHPCLHTFIPYHHLCLSCDIPADANRYLLLYQAYTSLFPLDFTSCHFPQYSVSVITIHLGLSYVNRLCHHTTLPYGLGILGVASHGVTTQMTYFTTCCFTLPHVCFMHHVVTSVLLFVYLMSLIPLVTYLFHILLFKHRVLVCLSQFEIST